MMGVLCFNHHFVKKTKWKSDHEHPLLRLPFLVLYKSSTVSVVFDFNASLSDATPAYPILFSVDWIRMEKSGLLMGVICVLFHLCSPPKSSFVSVVFDFNPSLNDVAPISPIQLTVDLMRMEKSGLLADAIIMLFLFVLPARLS